MHVFVSARRLFFCLLFVIVLALSACAGTSTTVGSTTPGAGAATATATSGGGSSPTATTPPTAPPHAFAWFQLDSKKVPQIWASLSGAVPKQITHVAPDNAACLDQVAWSPPVFSPDLTHIVASLGSYECGDGDMNGPLSIITASSGAIVAVPGNSSGSNFIRITQRAAGWVNNSTIWYINYAGLYTYSLGAASTTFVSSLGGAHPEEAALRGSTLFFSYENPGFGNNPSNQFLARFDMNSSSVLPGHISLGTAAGCACSPGDFRTPGWDVTADGSHVAYQVVSPGSSTTQRVNSSKFYFANADGSGASQIAGYVSTNQFARMLLAPNGGLVAITAALPSPSVITASVTSPGNSGDPNLHVYHPDAYDFPVWKWDSSEFWAASEATSAIGSGSSNIYAFTVSSSTSTVGVANAYNPWYTIGS